ncbi:glycosyltransferase family 2 protein [Mycetocola sp.]|uniref:glycosyltransferase family 2 protein n=1 Tax=Mycetocola sp. TaxID=1871042 RepID=UPI00398A235C
MRAAPVTVVIPCYISASTLRRAVESVYRQSLVPNQVVVVDDGSDDPATARCIRDLQRDYGERGLLVLAFSSNRGPSAARNAGWNLASQDFVAFLDADDEWHDRKIELQLQVMEHESRPALSGHAVNVGWSQLSTPARLCEQHVSAVSTPQLLRRNWFATSSVMVRRSVPARFNEQRRLAEDYEVWLKIALSGEDCRFIHVPLTTYYKSLFGEGGLSKQLVKMEAAQVAVYRDLKSEGRIATKSYFFLRVWSLIRFTRRMTIVGMRTVSKALR